jgi:hypothetical protein
MSQPFSKLHVLRTSTQGQEITLYIQRGILLLEKVLGGVRVVRCGAVHARRKRWGVRSRSHLNRLRGRRLSRISVVHLRSVVIVILVITASAKSLASIGIFELASQFTTLRLYERGERGRVRSP